MTIQNAFVAPTAIKTAAYTAQDGDLVPVDTTSAGVTITLPSPARDRTLVGVKLVKGSNTLTVNTGGSDTFNDNAATSFTTTLLNQGVIWQYAEVPGVWYALSGDVASSGMTNPMTTLGDIIYENSTPAAARLAGNTSATKNFLTQTGTGSVSAAPAWGTIAAGDVPGTLNATTFSGAVTVSGAALLPAVATLTDAATISVNAALGNDFRVTLGGNRTMGAPSNATDGQKIVFQIAQDGTGSRTLSWTTGSSGNYEFSANLAAPTLSTAANAVDVVGFIYNSSKARWLCVGYVLGF